MKRFLCAVLVAAMLCVTACGDEDTDSVGNPAQGSKAPEQYAEAGEVENVKPPALDLDFSNADGDASYDASTATKIVFSENEIAVTGEGAVADGTRLTVSSAGTYILSGECGDGKVTVSLGKNDKVKIVLDGLQLTCKDGAALLVTEADKVFLTLAKGSDNLLSDGASYTEAVEDTNVDGAIFSRADLTVNGEGSLSVNGNNKHGIVSKDDLILSGGGTLKVIATGVGLEGKDCVKLKDMTVSVQSGGDGVRSTNTEDSERGYVYVASGKLTVDAQKDGIQAETLLQIDGGTLSVKSGGGSANAPIKQDSMMGGGFRPGGSSTTTETEESAKGLKCTGTVLVNGGEISVDAYDDGIHADGDVGIAAGSTLVASGDDGVHAELILEIAGGALSVTKSYEGLEAGQIYIKGGNTSVVSSDDGLNASDGSGGMGGFGGFGNSTAYLCISDGYLFVNASGDGLDSNGNFDMQGGIVLVSGPTNSGNGALDFGDGCQGSVSGGILIALGASGMAENFTNAENQGAMLISTGACAAGTGIALCDADGNVLCSFTPPKSYQTAVITAPGILQGGTYSVYTGATVKNADGNGFGQNTALSGGEKLTDVEMTSLLYGGGMGGGFGGGGMPPGGGGGFRPGRK